MTIRITLDNGEVIETTVPATKHMEDLARNIRLVAQGNKAPNRGRKVK